MIVMGRRALSIICCLCFLPGADSASADVGSAEFVKGLTDAIKAQRSINPAVEAMDWEVAFNRVSAADRHALQLSSPQQLRQHELELYSGMGDKMLAGLAESLKRAKDEQRKLLEKMKSTAEANIQKQLAAAEDAFDRVKYTVGDSEDRDGSVVVSLSIELDGAERQEKVVMHQDSGGWKLDSVAPLNPLGTHGGALGTPIVMPGTGFVRGSR